VRFDVAAGSIRFEIAASTFLDRKIIQETRSAFDKTMTSRWRRTILEPRQMNEDGLDAREANHRMMNMLAILLALFHRNFSKFSDQCVRGAVTKFENQIMAASELLRTISSTSTAEDAAVDVYLERSRPYLIQCSP
jgi:two-component sensor histidine kinase